MDERPLPVGTKIRRGDDVGIVIQDIGGDTLFIEHNYNPETWLWKSEDGVECEVVSYSYDTDVNRHPNTFEVRLENHIREMYSEMLEIYDRKDAYMPHPLSHSFGNPFRRSWCEYLDAWYSCAMAFIDLSRYRGEELPDIEGHILKQFFELIDQIKYNDSRD